MKLTERDVSLLLALTSQIRLLTLSQIATGWWTPTLTGQKNAAHRVAHLIRSALVGRQEVLAHPLLPLAAPLVAWQPGESATNFFDLAKRLQSRWSAHPQRMVVYFATGRAAARFGGVSFGRVHNSCQTTHDIHVGQIFVQYRISAPEHLSHWVGEDCCDRASARKVPDALLRQADATPYRAVEFGGRYSAQRVREFHQFCESEQLPYEIW